MKLMFDSFFGEFTREDFERDAYKPRNCEFCGFQYHANKNLKEVMSVVKKILTEVNSGKKHEYNFMYLEVFCEDKYRFTKEPLQTSFKCDFSKVFSTNTLSEVLELLANGKCPECGKPLRVTMILLRVNLDSATSYCPKCRKQWKKTRITRKT